MGEMPLRRKSARWRAPGLRLDLQPRFAASDGALGGEPVAPGLLEVIAAAPLVSGPLVVAPAVLLGPPSERDLAALGVVGRELQRPAARHAPDDLDLVRAGHERELACHDQAV